MQPTVEIQEPLLISLLLFVLAYWYSALIEGCRMSVASINEIGGNGMMEVSNLIIFVLVK